MPRPTNGVALEIGRPSALSRINKMVKPTSAIAYHWITDSGIRGGQKRQILEFLIENRSDPLTGKHWNFTLKEIARVLDIEINAISGRVNELKKSGAVVEDPRRRCSITGRMVTPVCPNHDTRGFYQTYG